MYRLSVDDDDKITVVLDDLPEQLRASQRKKTEFVLLVGTICLHRDSWKICGHPLVPDVSVYF